MGRNRNYTPVEAHRKAPWTETVRAIANALTRQGGTQARREKGQLDVDPGRWRPAYSVLGQQNKEERRKQRETKLETANLKELREQVAHYSTLGRASGASTIIILTKSFFVVVVVVVDWRAFRGRIKGSSRRSVSQKA